MDDCLVKPIKASILLGYIADRCARPPAPGDQGSTDDQRHRNGNDALALDDEMLQGLRVELPARAQRIRKALQQLDYDALLEEAHKLNGTAAFCRFERLRGFAAKIEANLLQQQTVDLPELTDALFGEIESIVQELQPATEPGPH